MTKLALPIQRPEVPVYPCSL